MSNPITNDQESGLMTAEAYIAAKEAEEEADPQLYWWREMANAVHLGSQSFTEELLRTFRPLVICCLQKLQLRYGKHYPMDDLLQNAGIDLIVKLRKITIKNISALPHYIEKIVLSSFICYNRRHGAANRNEIPVSMGTDNIDEGGNTLLNSKDLLSNAGVDASKIATDKILYQQIQETLHEDTFMLHVLEKSLLQNYSDIEIAAELHSSREHVTRVRKIGMKRLKKAFLGKGIIPEIFAY